MTNVPAYSTDSVVQMVFAHLFNISNNVELHSLAVKDGAWTRSEDFTFTLVPQMEMAGKTMGIIGYGAIGQAVARVASALGMKVVVAPSLRQTAPDTESTTKHADLPADIVGADTMEQFFGMCDVISLHCPLTPRTRHIINAETIGMMKPTAILINTGRGPLVDEDALAAALNDGRLLAAGIDVLTDEPPVNGSPLIGARNCHITPHLAWATVEARERLLRIVAGNIEAFINGRAVNVVNNPVKK